MKLIWDQDDKEAVAASGSLAFSEIKGERARDYLRAHAKRRDDGTYYFEKARDAKLYEVMVEASKIPGRFYRNSGPCDILSIHWCALVLNKRFFTPFRDGIWNHRQVSVGDRGVLPTRPRNRRG